MVTLLRKGRLALSESQVGWGRRLTEKLKIQPFSWEIAAEINDLPGVCYVSEFQPIVFMVGAGLTVLPCFGHGRWANKANFKALPGVRDFGSMNVNVDVIPNTLGGLCDGQVEMPAASRDGASAGR